jgi:hypothetical protein
MTKRFVWTPARNLPAGRRVGKRYGLLDLPRMAEDVGVDDVALSEHIAPLRPHLVRSGAYSTNGAARAAA